MIVLGANIGSPQDEPGRGSEFKNKIIGGVIPGEYIPVVQKGVSEATEEGILPGFPVVDVVFLLWAALFMLLILPRWRSRLRLRWLSRAEQRGHTLILLESIMSVEFIVPEEYLGDVIGNLTSRRGKIVSIELRPSLEAINTEVPQVRQNWLLKDSRQTMKNKR